MQLQKKNLWQILIFYDNIIVSPDNYGQIWDHVPNLQLAWLSSSWQAHKWTSHVTIDFQVGDLSLVCDS